MHLDKPTPSARPRAAGREGAVLGGRAAGGKVRGPAPHSSALPGRHGTGPAEQAQTRGRGAKRAGACGARSSWLPSVGACASHVQSETVAPSMNPAVALDRQGDGKGCGGLRCPNTR